jgi:hypothetical protein
MRDGSGTKLQAAVAAISRTVLPARAVAASNLGLREYGGPCDGPGSQLTVPLAPNNREALEGALELLRPSGETTLVTGIRQAIEDVTAAGAPPLGAAEIVVITGGGDACMAAGSAAAVREVMDRAGGRIKFRFIGIDVAPEDRALLEDLVKAMGAGPPFYASSQRDLEEALQQFVTDLQQTLDEGRRGDSSGGGGGQVVPATPTASPVPAAATATAVPTQAPTPVPTPTPAPTPVPLVGPATFELGPGESRQYIYLVTQLRPLVLNISWVVTGNGLEVLVEAPGLDQSGPLLQIDALVPEVRHELSISQVHVGRQLLVTLRNATPGRTVGVLRLEPVPLPTPTPAPTPTAAPTPTPTPAPMPTTEVIPPPDGGAGPNRPPQLAPVGDREVNEGDFLEIRLLATDPDGDALSFTLIAQPFPGFCGLIESGPGAPQIRCAPGFTDAGVYSFQVSVEDAGTPPLSDSVAFRLTVKDYSGPR